MEMAQAHKRLGSDVSVIEGFNVLGKEDRELAHIVVERIKDEGVKIFENTKVVKVEKTKDKIVVYVDDSDGETKRKLSKAILCS